MAAYWNKPIIAYMATSNALADKTIYKTLARVSIRTINTQAEATGAFIKHYGWTKVRRNPNYKSLVQMIGNHKGNSSISHVGVGRGGG